MLALKRPLSPAVHMSLRIVLALLFIAAVILRISLYQVQTSDYTFFVSQWYDFIKTHGGFAAFKTNFSNYNVPYLYVLALSTFLPIPKLIAIKTTSVMFDALLALFTYLILNLRYKGSYLPIIGTLVVLFAPTIFINSAAWGQADATYAAFCLGSLYFLLKERPGWACAFFAIAISFKLQAVFFAPVLLIVLLKRRLPLKDLAKYLVLIPLIFLLFLVPAFIAGRDAWSLVTIYAGQVNTGGAGGGFGGQFNGRGAGGAGGFNGGTGGGTGGFTRGAGGAGGFPGGGFRGAGGTGGFPGGGFTRGAGGFGGRNFASSSLTLNAPSMYQWFPANTPDGWKWLGIILAGAVVVVVAALVWRSKEKFTSAILLKVALVFALALPFLLPEMHERYFYLADVLSIVYAFYFPRYFFVPILVQLCSLLSYAPYFWNRQVVGLSYVAFVELVVIIIVFTNLVLTLYPDLRKEKEASLAPTSEVSSEVTEVADGAVPS